MSDDRIDRLEREVRRLRRACGALLLGGLLLVAAGAGQRTARVVRARQFVVEDGAGHARIDLAADPDGTAAITLYDGSGRVRAAMAMTAKDDGLVGVTAADGSTASLVFPAKGRAYLSVADRYNRETMRHPQP